MAKVMVYDNVAIVVEARNIGFTKSVRDYVFSDELDGLELLIEETVGNAVKSVPVGFIITNIVPQVFNDGKNVLVTVSASRS